MKLMLCLGSAPTLERQPQDDSSESSQQLAIDCRVFLRQLNRQFSIPSTASARLTVKTLDRCGASAIGEEVLMDDEQKPARQVVVIYNDDRAEDQTFILKLASSLPKRWDAVALAERLWFRESLRYSRLVSGGQLSLDLVPETYRSVLPPDRSEFSTRYASTEPDPLLVM